MMRPLVEETTCLPADDDAGCRIELDIDLTACLG